MPDLRAEEEIARIPVLDRLNKLLAPSSAPFHVETPQVQRRRRAVVVVTSIVGAVVLAKALNEPKTGGDFTWWALALASVWIVGAFASGPLHLGRWGQKRDLAKPLVLAVGAWAVFAAGATVIENVSFFSPVADQVNSIISRADGGFWATALVVFLAVLNGLSEEVFFRGAVYSAFGRHHAALWSTAVYTVVTAAAFNAPLALAALIMGTLWALERRATRGILASSVTHMAWGVLMIFLLPR